MTKFLEDLIDLDPFSKEINKSPRQVRRYLERGLPYTRLGNRILIHIPTAREWLLGQMRHGAPRRRERASAARSKPAFEHGDAVA